MANVMIHGIHIADPLTCETGLIQVWHGELYGRRAGKVLLTVNEDGEEAQANATLTPDEAVALATRLLLMASEARTHRFAGTTPGKS